MHVYTGEPFVWAEPNKETKHAFNLKWNEKNVFTISLNQVDIRLNTAGYIHNTDSYLMLKWTIKVSCGSSNWLQIL